MFLYFDPEMDAITELVVDFYNTHQSVTVQTYNSMKLITRKSVACVWWFGKIRKMLLWLNFGKTKTKKCWVFAAYNTLTPQI